MHGVLTTICPNLVIFPGFSHDWQTSYITGYQQQAITREKLYASFGKNNVLYDGCNVTVEHSQRGVELQAQHPKKERKISLWRSAVMASTLQTSGNHS